MENMKKQAWVSPEIQELDVSETSQAVNLPEWNGNGAIITPFLLWS